MIHTLRKLFDRDLHKLKEEIELYQNEDRIWYIEKNIANSGGNLCLHLVGNLKTYIGLHIGNFAYTRQRDLEFSLKNVPRTELIQHIQETIEIVDKSLSQLDESRLKEDFPIEVFSGKTTTIEYMLTHLATHLSYHLGQVNYHRRLLDSE
ncbi:MAG: DinB superfamily protein [Pseudopedobacter saltans]|uniref:DinB superfamily protein n=1 Tax=Pseudopedobacter saltans TaxID=151895 RepID=A0A2W5F651_9SPHI|nr:MAG: DinB superfamily protein [Pseudopedobacter saltans]